MLTLKLHYIHHFALPYSLFEIQFIVITLSVRPNRKATTQLHFNLFKYFLFVNFIRISAIYQKARHVCNTNISIKLGFFIPIAILFYLPK